MLRLELGLVGGSGGDARFCIAMQLIASVKRDGQRLPKFSSDLAGKLRSGNPETIIGNGESVCLAQARGKFLLNFLVSAIGQSGLWLVVEAQNLLRNRMSPACEKPALRRSCPPFRAKNAVCVYSLMAKVLDECIAGSIITNNRNRQDFCPEGSKIIRGVGSAPWNHLRLAMFQDQDRGFPRNTGDVAVAKFIGDKISEKHNRFSGEFVDTLGEIAKVYRCGRGLWGWGPLHLGCLRIQSTA